MSSKNFNSFKDFQSDQIQTSSRKLFTAHYACSNSDLNLQPVTRTTNGFIFPVINSLIESWGVRLACFDCKKMTYIRKFCYLNSSCIRKGITLMFVSFSRNNFTLLFQNLVTVAWNSSDCFEPFIRLLRVVFSSQQRLNRRAVNAVQWRHSLPENRVVILIGWLSKHSLIYV